MTKARPEIPRQLMRIKGSLWTDAESGLTLFMVLPFLFLLGYIIGFDFV